MRSAKKPTAVSAPTASITATTSSRSSPALKSRQHLAPAELPGRGRAAPAASSAGRRRGAGCGQAKASSSARNVTRVANAACNAVESAAAPRGASMAAWTPDPALVFLSHGSPMIALEPGAAGAFLQRLGPGDRRRLRPAARAIVTVVRAHRGARAGRRSRRARHEAVHDFGGFTRSAHAALRRARRPALAPHVEQLLQGRHRRARATQAASTTASGCRCATSARAPTSPCCPSPSRPTIRRQQLFELGAALRAAGRRRRAGSSAPAASRTTCASSRPARAPTSPSRRKRRVPRLVRRARPARDWHALFAYRSLAPDAVEMHPTDEHLLPWFIAAGAGGRDAAPCACTPARAWAPGHGRLRVRRRAPASSRAPSRDGRARRASRGDGVSAPSARCRRRRRRTSPSP